MTGLDAGFSRIHSLPASPEPERAFADYLAYRSDGSEVSNSRDDFARSEKTDQEEKRSQDVADTVRRSDGGRDEKRAVENEGAREGEQARKDAVNAAAAQAEEAKAERDATKGDNREDFLRNSAERVGALPEDRESQVSGAAGKEPPEEKNRGNETTENEAAEKEAVGKATVREEAAGKETFKKDAVPGEAAENKAAGNKAAEKEPVKKEADATGVAGRESTNGESTYGERASRDALAVDSLKPDSKKAASAEDVPEKGRSGNDDEDLLSAIAGLNAAIRTEPPEKTPKAASPAGEEKKSDLTVRAVHRRDRADGTGPTIREIVVNLRDNLETGGEEEKRSGEFREVPLRVEGTVGNDTPRGGSMQLSEATANLARRLNGSLGDSIVRQAQVIMKDATQGEIRLIIRPPDLGRVRILLEMDQGHIAGRILVDNQSVRQVIEQNLAALQRAFQEAGLEMGDLDVSTGDARQDAESDSRQAGDADRRRPIEDGSDRFGRNVKTRAEFDYGHRRINLVA
ncbi:MAG: flagellar hook-length control protein FliK [Spirochaetaceae bacterium]|nr:MAG: flagellar hook-length control protein FliK [Spirochaetaceae bacterium]